MDAFGRKRNAMSVWTSTAISIAVNMNSGLYSPPGEMRLAVGGPAHGKTFMAPGYTTTVAVNTPARPGRASRVIEYTYAQSEVRIGSHQWRVWRLSNAEPVEVAQATVRALIESAPEAVDSAREKD